MNDSKYNEMAQILGGFRINGIRQSGKQLETVLRFQDIIGTSTKDDLIEMWTKQMKLDPNLKRVFIWAVTSTCGFEMAESVIEYTMGLDVKKRIQAQFEKAYKELEADTIELCNERNEFNEEKRQAKILQDKQNQILAILAKNN